MRLENTPPTPVNNNRSSNSEQQSSVATGIESTAIEGLILRTHSVSKRNVDYFPIYLAVHIGNATLNVFVLFCLHLIRFDRIKLQIFTEFCYNHFHHSPTVLLMCLNVVFHMLDVHVSMSFIIIPRIMQFLLLCTVSDCLSFRIDNQNKIHENLSLIGEQFTGVL